MSDNGHNPHALSNQPGPSGLSPQQEQDMRIARTLRHVRHKLLVMSGKGGVGKTTVAVNLATALAKAGHRVGLMDIDLHGPSVPYMLGLQDKLIRQEDDKVYPVEYMPNLKVLSIANLMELGDNAIIWRGPLKIGAIRQFLADIDWGELDYMVIDSPPGTGDEPLTTAQTFTGVQAVVVTTPQEISLADVRKSISFCRKVQMPVLGVVENMSGPIFGKGGGEKLAKDMGLTFLGSLPMDGEVVKAADEGRPYMALHEDSEVGKAFMAIAEQVNKICVVTPPKMPEGFSKVQFVSKKTDETAESTDSN
ncbi:MAG: Mrp/NBP35 family ATP-binding protein [Deltaproteobacteria bacterium]|nr:Mrp/NBP35 family ATP-binding protein [Deltaproteobacteria bacterium]MCB9478574.1 Mrp/NBP35 family ATP-binding protein [Deltaproteobacteria bacterium]MCB9488342.1 Mrp/NBP35 family ATP-binding protein [Deltaproteobacteria bacterium]